MSWGLDQYSKDRTSVSYFMMDHFKNKLVRSHFKGVCISLTFLLPFLTLYRYKFFVGIWYKLFTHSDSLFLGRGNVITPFSCILFSEVGLNLALESLLTFSPLCPLVPLVYLQAALLVGFSTKQQRSGWPVGGNNGSLCPDTVLGSAVSFLYCPCKCRLTGQLTLDVVLKRELLPV